MDDKQKLILVALLLQQAAALIDDISKTEDKPKPAGDALKIQVEDVMTSDEVLTGG